MGAHDNREDDGTTLEKDQSQASGVTPVTEFKSKDRPDEVRIRVASEDAECVMTEPKFFIWQEEDLRQRFAMTLVHERVLERVADDDFFCEMIFTAVDRFNVSQAALAQQLQTQSSNITRWKEGRHAPAVYGRAGILWTIHALIMRDAGLEPMPFKPR